MMKIVFSRHHTYLTILAVLTLTVFDSKYSQAERPADTIQVDAFFFPFLLTSMSPLVESPYTGLASLNYPLDAEDALSPRNDAIHSMVARPLRSRVVAIDNSAEELATKIAVIHDRDFTLSPELSTSIELSTKQLIPAKNSLAMIGR